MADEVTIRDQPTDSPIQSNHGVLLFLAQNTIDPRLKYIGGALLNPREPNERTVRFAFNEWWARKNGAWKAQVARFFTLGEKRDWEISTLCIVPRVPTSILEHLLKPGEYPMYDTFRALVIFHRAVLNVVCYPDDSTVTFDFTNANLFGYFVCAGQLHNEYGPSFYSHDVYAWFKDFLDKEPDYPKLREYMNNHSPA